ncbi:putative F-box protein At1g47765 [Lolium perenne]|uniref:putative F-box protein At1g47765 n=1 Tax=Lolium perenne TaxID=4522 RepID=UPI0021F59A19|nr:putative F-box protein At1g47765 [Lolium perenne]
MTTERSPECRSSLLSPLGAVTTTTAASAAAVSLPNDLVFDILSRLQVKPLCRFRCVSRGWRALISDPVFATMHKSPIVSFSKENPCALYRDLRLMDMDGNVVKAIEGKGSIGLHSTSVDSLICVVANVFSGLAHVVDLATGEALLDCPESKDLISYRQCVFGFGRSAPSGLYKVVRLWDYQTGCEVLTVGEDTEWRTAQSSPVYISAYRSSPVAVNGNIYFLISFHYRGPIRPLF